MNNTYFADTETLTFTQIFVYQIRDFCGPEMMQVENAIDRWPDDGCLPGCMMAVGWGHNYFAILGLVG